MGQLPRHTPGVSQVTSTGYLECVVGIMIIPQGQHQYSSIFEDSVHRLHAALLEEITSVLCLGDPICAHSISDGIIPVAIECTILVLMCFSILSVELTRLNHGGIISAIISDELCGDIVGVNIKLGTRVIEVTLTKAPGLDVATILVTHTPLNRVSPLSPQSSPSHLYWKSSGVSQECIVNAVGILFVSHKSISVQQVRHGLHSCHSHLESNHPHWLIC